MEDDHVGCVVMLMLLIMSFFLGAFFYDIIYIKGNPTAMDVYQGKTTLKYTIVDDIKTDSCVILKNKEE